MNKALGAYFYSMICSAYRDFRRIENPIFSWVVYGHIFHGYLNHPIAIDLVTHLHHPLISSDCIAQYRLGTTFANIRLS